MRRFVKCLVLAALLVGGFLFWQEFSATEHDRQLGEPSNAPPASLVQRLQLSVERLVSSWLPNQSIVSDVEPQTVSLRGQTIANSNLDRSRRDLTAFKPFPFDFNVRSISGQALRKSDFEGRVLIVDIWATWCPPCRAEIPSFVKLRDQYGDHGLSIVGFNFERGKSRSDAVGAIQSFCRLQPIGYPLVIGEDSFLKQVPDFSGYPTTLFIDGSGRVRMKLVGAYPYEKLESYALALLAELDKTVPEPKIEQPAPMLPSRVKSFFGSGPEPQQNPFASQPEA